MLKKIKMIVFMLLLAISNLLIGQTNPISGFEVIQKNSLISDSTQTDYDDTALVFYVEIQFALLDPSMKINISAGSQLNLSDAVSQTYSIVYFKNKYFIQNATGENCAQLIGNGIRIPFRIYPSQLLRHKYWRVWLTLEDNSTTIPIHYIMP